MCSSCVCSEFVAENLGYTLVIESTVPHQREKYTPFHGLILYNNNNNSFTYYFTTRRQKTLGYVYMSPRFVLVVTFKLVYNRVVVLPP